MPSDYGHELTDREVAALEARIREIYIQARDELQSTVDAYFESFWERDSEMRRRLDAGEITANDYRQWRLAQIGRGERFEALRDTVAERYTYANEVAVSYINDKTPGIYSLNHNYMAYTIEQVAGDVGFTLLDEQTVRRLILEAPDLMPHYPALRAVQRGIDLAWGKKQITAAVTSGILQGNGLKQVADDLQKRIQTMERDSALRAARTALTGAECAGRQDSLSAAKKRGISVKKEWLACADSRTRHAHAVLDGQKADVDKPFKVDGQEIMYPGDPHAKGELVYNCRCTLVGDLQGVREEEPTMRRVRNPETGENERISDMTYAEWEKWKKSKTNQSNRDILTSIELKEIPITDDAIDSIQLIQPNGWNKRTAEKLQQECKDILRAVKDKPLGTEAGCVYDTDMHRLINIRIGKPGANRVNLPSCNSPYITMHTHPDGEIFSGTDIENFLWSATAETMIVTTNDGKVFCFHKMETYDGFEVMRLWERHNRELIKHIANNDVEAYITQVRKFLREAEQYGTQFIQK